MRNPYEKGNTETLEKVQRRAARFVKGADYRQRSSVTQVIKDLGWQSLLERRAVNRLTLMYKAVHGLPEVQFSNLITKTRTTRNSSGGFRNVRANKNCYRSSFLPRTIPEWNNLPDKIRNAPSLDSFKNSLTNQINTKDLVQTSHYYC